MADHCLSPYLKRIARACDSYVATALAAMSIFLSGYTPTAYADLEGYWSFNEGAGTAAADSSGNANNGGFAASSWTAGQSGGAGDNALNVLGGSQAVSVPAGGFGNIGTNNAVTLSLWLYGDVAQQPRTNTTIQGMNGGTRIIFTHIPWVNGIVYWDSGDRTNTGVLPASSYEGSWSYWTFIKDGNSDFGAIYRNGALLASSSNRTANLSGLTSLILGANYRGFMDDVAIYSQAISTDAITAMATGTFADVTYNDAIVGSNGYIKAGAGTTTLNADNKYLGDTSLNAGTILVGQLNGLGASTAGTTVASGATLQLNVGGTYAEPMTINGAGVGGNGALTSTGANKVLGNTLTLGSDATIGGTNRIDMNAEITDGGNGYTLTKTGTFDFVRSGTANFSHLVIDQGAYTMTGNPALPGGVGTSVTLNSGTALTLWSDRVISNSPNVILNSGSFYDPARPSANSSSINGTMTINGSVQMRSWSTDHSIFSDISGAGNMTLLSRINNQDSARYQFAGNNSYTGNTTVGTGSAGVGKMTLRARSTTALGDDSAFNVTANSTLELGGNDNAVGSLTGAGTVEDSAQIFDDFSSGSVSLVGTRMYEAYIDGGWRARQSTGLGASAWTVSGGTLNNASSSVGPYGGPDPYYQAEGAVIQMVATTMDSASITLEFDYSVPAGDSLYVHFWGYTGSIVGAGTRIGNNETGGGTYFNEESEVIGASGTELDAYNLKDGNDGTGTSIGNTANSISGALTGAGTYSTTIAVAALGIPGVTTSGDLSYLSLAFAKDEDGTAGTTAIDNAVLRATQTTVTTGGDDSSTSFSGVIQDGGGVMALAKAGSGIQTLTGTNTYSGTTTVNAGTLAINGANNGTGGVAVNSGGTLGGAGSLAGLVTVNSGGHVAAGVAVGTLTLSAGMTLNDGAELDADLTLGGAADLIDITGGTLTGSGASGVTVNLTVAGGTPSAASIYTLMDWSAAAESGVEVGDFTVAVTSGPAAVGYRLSIVGQQLLLEVAPTRTVFRFQ
ncbi:MAG: fibronectin-binding autotransporter adhesin [Rhodothermales bacterium]|jgi:fibronectin-binding autotransporter adhesin